MLACEKHNFAILEVCFPLFILQCTVDEFRATANDSEKHPSLVPRAQCDVFKCLNLSDQQSSPKDI